MHEMASFRGDDDHSLVEASLACRVCLSGDVDWALEIGDFDGQVLPLPERGYRASSP